MAKIKKEHWKEIRGFMGDVKDVVASGGLSSFFKGQLLQIKQDMIDMIVNPILEPILQELGPEIATLVEEIGPMVADLGKFISDILGIEIGDKTLITHLTNILSFSMKWTSVIGLLEPMGEIIGRIWKKMGDIFGFETESPDVGPFTVPWGPPGPSGRQERLESIEWD